MTDRAPAPDSDDGPVTGDSPVREHTLREYIDELGSRPDTHSRIDRARAKAVATAERLTTWGPLGPWAEVGWQAWRRDRQIAGSVLAAAVAYRIFIWLLPLALVLVGVLGLLGRTATLHGAADVGVSTQVAQSVAQAATTGSLIGRIIVIVTALLVFLYESYVLLRTLRAISAFAWRTGVRPMRRPARQTSIFLGMTVVVVAVLALTTRIAAALHFPFGVAMALITLAAVPAYVVAVSMVLLPHRAAGWRDFLPGALLIYAAYAAAHLVATLVVVPWVSHKQATYGVLGISAALLFLMFVFGRIVELSFTLSAVVAEGRADGRDVPSRR